MNKNRKKILARPKKTSKMAIVARPLLQKKMVSCPSCIKI